MSNKKHNEFIASLQALKESPGWKIIKKVLDDNIKDAENDMFDEDKKSVGLSDEMQRLDSLRKQRNERKRMTELPDELIKLYSEPVNFEKDFDPYM